MLATSEDLRYLGTEGAPASKSTKQMHKYMDYLLRSATRSVPVRKRFLEVQGMLMLKGPGVLFRPSVGMRVAKEALLSSLAWARALRTTSRKDGKEFERTG
jgi:hypothetical protein